MLYWRRDFLILAAIVLLLGQNQLVVAFGQRAATFWRVPHDRFRASREPRGLFHTQQLRNVFSGAPLVLFLRSCHGGHTLKLALFECAACVETTIQQQLRTKN